MNEESAGVVECGMGRTLPRRESERFRRARSRGAEVMEASGKRVDRLRNQLGKESRRQMEDVVQ